MNKQSIKYLLFDLGKVLVKLDGKNVGKTWFPNHTPEQIYHKWMSFNSIQHFEKGQISLEQFLVQAPAEIGIQMSSHDFHELYKSWLVGEYTGASKLLQSLKEHFKIGCLSNTNSIHADILRKQGFLDQFDAVFLSNEIGLMKPDPLAYQHVIKYWKAEPNEILFLDDRPDNVASAQEIGINAHIAEGLDQVKTILQEYT